MYKKITLSQYEQDKFQAYTSLACSRFEVSISIKKQHFKNYNFIYALSKSVNETKELKLSVIDNEIYEFTTLHPSYVLLKDENIVSTYTNYDNDYKNFISNYKQDMDKFNNSDLTYCLKQAPQNCFYISSFKGEFENFSLQLKHGFDFFQPIFTNFTKEDKIILSGNFHHAFFDLLKARKFFDNFLIIFNSLN